MLSGAFLTEGSRSFWLDALRPSKDFALKRSIVYNEEKQKRSV